MDQSKEFVPPSSGEESENENFESVLFNHMFSASKLIEQMQQTSSYCDHDNHDNSATELQRRHVVTDIETNFTIGANGLSSPEHNTALKEPALQAPDSPEPALWAPLSPDTASQAPLSPGPAAQAPEVPELASWAQLSPDPYLPAPPSPEVPLPTPPSPVPNCR